LKKKIKIKFQNGLTFRYGIKEILDYVKDQFEFIESDEPDFIIFGPYGANIPEKNDKYTRIGYFCENIAPDLSICEWAFGMPNEEEIGDIRYKKIQWHNLNPRDLIKADFDVDQIINSKSKFCNFLYSHRVPYRESFFKALSKYKKVDSPGRSMNNMESIDSLLIGNKWDQKRRFLKPYKFTISFENYSYPGYQTEKIYDAMLERSIPIYCGDPLITELFNPKSFINAFDFLKPNYGKTIRSLERYAQMDFIDFRPREYHSFPQQIIRKVKSIGRDLKMKLEFNSANYKNLVDKIVEIDEDDKLFREMLIQPWFNNNQVPPHSESVDRWTEIFGGA
jgi:hypothetical protein